MEKKVLVTRSSMPSLDEYVEEIKELWDTRWLTNMGKKHEELRERLKDYLNVPYIDLFTNGHMALEVALSALDLKGEVITTPFTFVSTVDSIVRCGLTPVFCDVKEDDCTIDENKLEELINDKTSAILAVHVYGNMCNVEKIESIARKHNLKVIYDAAHAFGVKYKGISSGSFGDISCFSFHATKVFNTIEGGACCFHEEKLENTIFQLKDFGIKNAEEIERIGFNAKMNEFCAAMGICNLKHLPDEIMKRKKVYERYCHNLENVPGIRVNHIQKGVESNYAYFPIFVDKKAFGFDRNEINEYLAKNGIFSRKYFYPAINNTKAFESFNHGDTPVSDYLSNIVLTLPFYADLDLEEVDNICNHIKRMANLI